MTVFYQNFSNISYLEQFSGNTSSDDVFGESVNGTFRDLLKRPVFEKKDSNWIETLSNIRKQYKIRIYSST